MEIEMKTRGKILHRLWVKALTQLFFVLTATASVICFLATYLLAVGGVYNRPNYLPELFVDPRYVLFDVHWGKVGYANRVLLPILAVCFLALTITLFVFALRGAGRKPGSEEIKRSFFAKCPLDILLALIAVPVLFVSVLPAFANEVLLTEGVLVVAACSLAADFYLFLAYWLCFAANVKRGQWWRNTLVFLAGRLFVRCCRRYAGLCREKLNRIPVELYALVLGGGMILFWAGVGLFWDAFVQLVCFLLGLLCAIALLIGLVVRLKTSGWWRQSLVYGCCRLVKLLPLYWQAGLAFAGLCFVDFIIIGITNGGEIETALTLFLLLRIALFVLIAWGVVLMRRLQKGAKELANGDLHAQVPTERMFGVFKTHAEDLNRIRGGMQTEIDERMRSERFKTELITNVSHDIKTPLTSIINYVDLLGKRELDDPEARGYLEVLERQSARLKKLIEDLIEASKASTGNVSVNLADTDICALLHQVVCEYEEKLSEGGLTVVCQIPNSPVRASADAAQLRRVFDNLLSNIVHYALAGTRVYVGLAQIEFGAEISFRNISRDELVATAESDLLERFVRGDSARNTQGSGLGLSIAKNLTELMGGTLTLTIDGDLFKVSLVMRK